MKRMPTSRRLTNIRIPVYPNPALTAAGVSRRMDSMLLAKAWQFRNLYQRQVARSAENPKLHLADSGTIRIAMGGSRNDRHVAWVTFNKRYAAIHEARAHDFEKVISQMAAGL